MFFNVLIYMAKTFSRFATNHFSSTILLSLPFPSSEPPPLPFFSSSASRRLSLPLPLPTVPDFHNCIRTLASVSPSPCSPSHLFVPDPTPPSTHLPISIPLLPLPSLCSRSNPSSHPPLPYLHSLLPLPSLCSRSKPPSPLPLPFLRSISNPPCFLYPKEKLAKKGCLVIAIVLPLPPPLFLHPEEKLAEKGCLVTAIVLPLPPFPHPEEKLAEKGCSPSLPSRIQTRSLQKRMLSYIHRSTITPKILELAREELPSFSF